MLTALLLVQALAAGAVAAAPQDQARFEACIAKVETDPAAAYEEATAWAGLEKAREARWCAAQALVKLGRYEEAARRFETLGADLTWTEANRLDAHAEAGNAWLLAKNTDRALAELNIAVRMSGADPDALIDRARAYAMRKDWPKAEEDLSQALDKRPQDALALSLRSAARVRQSAFDLAVKDAEDAAKLDPENINVLLTLGEAREAQRTGNASAGDAR